MSDARTNHLLQLVHQRVNRLIARLEPRRWRTLAELPVTVGPLHEDWITLEQAQGEAHEPLRAGMHLGSGWNQRWCRVDIPAGDPGRFLAWRCQGETTAWRAPAGGEWVPWAGLDVAHPTCPLPAEATTVWLDLGTWQTALWAPGATALGPQGPRFDGCALLARDAQVHGCLADLDVLRQLLVQLFKDHRLEMPATIGHCPPLERVDPLLRRLLGGLDAACDAHDRDGVAALATALATVRSQLRAAPWQGAVAAVAQTHIDLVYLWPERVGEAKAVHSCATQLRLLDADPAYTFSHSQPLQYLAIGRRAPRLLEEMRARIAEGRWEVTGGFACEPDTNLPCGEALFRNLRLGQQLTTELAGAPSTVCWLPDVFGYSACLPALLRLGGIEGFFTTKLSWSRITRFPWTSFTWRGADGTAVLAHLCPVGYNSNAQVDVLLQAARDHREVHVHDEQAVPLGYGDGGGGPNEETLERVARMGDLALVPRTRWSRADAFVARLAADAAALPVHQGELFLENHLGVFTSQQGMKSAYRRLELALQAWEAARCAQAPAGSATVDRHPWERLCFAQFHDALPGSSIALVFAELVPELRTLGDDCLARAGSELGTATADAPLRFNPLPFPRTVVDGDRLWRLPALGSGPSVAPSHALEASPTRLANGVVEAHFADGQLRALRIAGEDLPLSAGTFTLAGDDPATYDAWEIDRPSLRLARAIDLPAPEVLVCDATRAVLRTTAAIGERSRLTVDYVLEAGARHLRVEVMVDWREDHRLLRYELTTACAGAHARYGSPFGSVLRRQQASDPQAEAQWEVPGCRWAAALRDDGSGIALLTASNWGFSCRDGVLGVSLLRAPTYPDPGCDRGQQHLRLAIGRHESRFADSAAGAILPTAAAAEALFAPVLPTARAIPGLPWAALGSLVPAWASPAADGIELRLHEVAGSAGRVAIPPGFRTVPVDALGRRGEPLAALEYGPYAIVSVVLLPE